MRTAGRHDGNTECRGAPCGLPQREGTSPSPTHFAFVASDRRERSKRRLYGIPVALIAIALVGVATSGGKMSQGASAPEPPPRMVYVPAGEFIMGSEIGDDDERPQRLVHVDAFFIDKYEVSNAEFKKFKPPHGFKPGEENHAVMNATWEEADAYAKWIGKRLPTEAEWEKAARGTDGRMFPWGNRYDITMAALREGDRVDTAPAGVSPYGCYNMAGNVWEWVSDWYKPYPGNTIPSPAYGEKYRVIRGGADFCDRSFQRCAHRYYVDPKTTISGYAIGFRCAKTP